MQKEEFELKRLRLRFVLSIFVLLATPAGEAQTGINPAQLEVNLGFIQIGNYTPTYPNNLADLIDIPSCTGAYEACMTGSVLSSYAAQGVTGVRFQFDITGYHDPAPFIADTGSNQGSALNTNWLNNLSLFFHDLKAANITNITLTPDLAGDTGTWGTMGLPFCTVNNARVPLGGACTTPDILYFPWLPYPIVPYRPGGDGNGYPYSQDPNGYQNIPSLAQDPYGPNLAQYAWGWQDATCVNWTGHPVINGSQVTWSGGPTPAGCSPFILWFRQVVKAAALAGLTIEEVDLSQETDLSAWPIIARLIWDNQQYSYLPPGSFGTPVLETLSNIMVSVGNFPAGRVTLSGNAGYPAFWSNTDPNSPRVLHDCGSYYGDSQTMITESEIIAAAGGGNIGHIYNQVDPKYDLACFTPGDDASFMFALPIQPQPTLNDVHITPAVPAADTPSPGWGTLPPYTTLDAQLIAKTVYSDFWLMLENHSPPICPQCTDLRSNTVMIGETDSNDPYAGNGDPHSVPLSSANAAGLMESYLASDEYGNSHLSKVILRPWERLTPTPDLQYEIPANIGFPNGPYNPCTFSLSPTSANIASTGGSGQTWLSESGTCQWTVSSVSSWLTVTSPTAPFTGSVAVNYSVSANTGSTARTGTLTVAGTPISITQSAASGAGTVSPANGATGVSVTPTLTWPSVGGALGYAVYFGTTSSPPMVGSTSTTGYVPGTLSAGTAYYWKTVPLYTGGQGPASQVYSFATAGTTVSGSFDDWNFSQLPGGSVTLTVDGQSQPSLSNPYTISVSAGQHTISTSIPSGYTLAGYSLQGGPKVNSSSVTFSAGTTGISLNWFYLPASVSLSNVTLNSPSVYYASSTITAGTGVTVGIGAGVSFQSGGQIILTQGFHAGGTGGTGTAFHAYIANSW
jgi:hypothetical protein